MLVFFRTSVLLNLAILEIHRGETFAPPAEYTTAGVQATVIKARAHSLSRNNGVLNSELDPQTLYRLFAKLRPMQIYERAASAERLTMRSWLNTLRVALSIADIDGNEVEEIHIMEAMQYRFLRKRIEQIQSQAA